MLNFPSSDTFWLINLVIRFFLFFFSFKSHIFYFSTGFSSQEMHKTKMTKMNALPTWEPRLYLRNMCIHLGKCIAPDVVCIIWNFSEAPSKFHATTRAGTNKFQQNYSRIFCSKIREIIPLERNSRQIIYLP